MKKIAICFGVGWWLLVQAGVFRLVGSTLLREQFAPLMENLANLSIIAGCVAGCYATILGLKLIKKG